MIQAIGKSYNEAHCCSCGVQGVTIGILIKNADTKIWLHLCLKCATDLRSKLKAQINSQYGIEKKEE